MFTPTTLSYIFVIRAVDGHYVTGVHEINHGVNGYYRVESSGMFFDPYGVVYMTFNFFSGSSSAFNGYAARLAVGGFDVNTKAMKFFWHQEEFYGEGFGVTYIDQGEG